VNPGDTTITGNVQFFNQSGQAVTLTANSQSVSTFPYSIPRAGSFTLLTAGAGANFVSGSIHVTPDMGSATPISQEIISFKSLGITATSFGSWSNAGTGLRMFVETAGSFGDVGSIQGGVAIANASSSATQVTVSLTDLNGGPQASTSVAIAANGQAAFFLRDLFPSLPAAFKGILRVTTSGSGLSVTGLRARFNGRGDFLFTSAAPVNESMSATSATTIVPHFLDGGGFTSEFNLFSGSAGQATSGHLRFYRGDASPLTLTLSGLPKNVKAQITSE
jgi:hypothetical protein